MESSKLASYNTVYQTTYNLQEFLHQKILHKAAIMTGSKKKRWNIFWLFYTGITG